MNGTVLKTLLSPASACPNASDDQPNWDFKEEKLKRQPVKRSYNVIQFTSIYNGNCSTQNTVPVPLHKLLTAIPLTPQTALPFQPCFPAQHSERHMGWEIPEPPPPSNHFFWENSLCILEITYNSGRSLTPSWGWQS